jgi:hypothetical protein
MVWSGQGRVRVGLGWSAFFVCNFRIGLDFLVSGQIFRSTPNSTHYLVGSSRVKLFRLVGSGLLGWVTRDQEAAATTRPSTLAAHFGLLSHHVPVSSPADRVLFPTSLTPLLPLPSHTPENLTKPSLPTTRRRPRRRLHLPRQR